MKSLPCVFAVCTLSMLPACGNDSASHGTPADVHGTYSLNVTNGPSTCPLQGWTEGAQTMNVPLIVTQNGSSVSADVGNAGALFLDLWCGNAHLAGSVSGSDVELALTGTRSLSSGSCAFTVDAHVSVTAVGDTLSGSITYTPNTNSSADCTAVNTCSARMNLNGTRPPPSN